MIGIAAIGTYLPETRIDNVERAEAAGKTREFITDKVGFRTLARKSADISVVHLCQHAFADLDRLGRIDRPSVDCVILCTQNPDGGGLPHNSALIQGALGLPKHVAAFDISLGCSGYVYSLSIARAFMEANGLRNGLLFTADPYSTIIEPGEWNTDLLFGDGAAVTHLCDEALYSIRAGMFATDGSMAHSIAIEEKSGYVRMLGSNVFKFCMDEVPAQIGAYLAREGLAPTQVDLYLLHQGSKFIIDNLARRMEIDPAKVPFGAGETGNLVSSSIPFLLKPWLERGAERPHRILMSGFGVGLSWATLMIDLRDAAITQG